MASLDFQIVPASKAVAITPNDNTDLPITVRAVYVGGVGNLAVILKDDTTAVIFAGVPIGTLLPILVRRVLATGTTATSLIGLI